jgi:outer membrane protein assembly factor BamB
MLLCLGTRQGGTLWKKDYPFPSHSLHKFNSFAASSPVVDAERVYHYWATPGSQTLTALTHDGTPVWERELGPYESQHGGGTSPMVYDGKVILANEQRGKSFIAAFDAATGKPVWKTPRTSTTAAYSTPCIFEPKNGKPTLVFNSQSHGIYGVDPSTGAILWEYTQAFDKRSVSSPIVASGLLIGSCGSGGGGNYVVAVRPPGEPGGKPELAYEIRRSAPYVPTSIAVDDLLFLWSDGGIVTCVYGPTGEIRWQERVGGNFFGSPVCADGKLYCVSTAGEVVVIPAADRFEVIARNPLNELTHATPAISGGQMFIRTEKHLLCVGTKKSS